jgi:hypothetical protein
MPKKTLTFALMDAPYESANLTTAFRILDAAARRGHRAELVPPPARRGVVPRNPRHRDRETCSGLIFSSIKGWSLGADATSSVVNGLAPSLVLDFARAVAFCARYGPERAARGRLNLLDPVGIERIKGGKFGDHLTPRSRFR